MSPGITRVFSIPRDSQSSVAMAIALVHPVSVVAYYFETELPREIGGKTVAGNQGNFGTRSPSRDRFEQSSSIVCANSVRAGWSSTAASRCFAPDKSLTGIRIMDFVRTLSDISARERRD